MRLLYINYPICQTLSGKLSWSHYTELLSISDDLSRSFYEKQCISENWFVRELKRQRQTGLFERIALSKDKVAPLTGAWIETKNNAAEKMAADVAPLTGAWIETVGYTVCLIMAPTCLISLHPILFIKSMAVEFDLPTTNRVR